MVNNTEVSWAYSRRAPRFCIRRPASVAFYGPSGRLSIPSEGFPHAERRLHRFVEEGYRDEPQTAIIAGLRLYQWIAIALTIAGALITAVAQSAAAPAPALNWSGIAWAHVFAGVARSAR